MNGAPDGPRWKEEEKGREQRKQTKGTWSSLCRKGGRVLRLVGLEGFKGRKGILLAVGSVESFICRSVSCSF